MPILLLPPPQFIADNGEIPKLVRLKAQNFQQQLLQELGINGASLPKKLGDFPGTQSYSWGEKFDGLLWVSFLFEKGQGYGKLWASTATLVRKNDCLHLGSRWSYESKSVQPFAPENSSLKLLDFSRRIFSSLSPVKVDLFSFDQDKAKTFLYNLVISEEFSEKKVALINNFGNIFCRPQTSSVAMKPHRLLEIKLSSSSLKKEDKNKVDYSVQMNSAVFGQKAKDVIVDAKKTEFQAKPMAESLVQKVLPTLDDISLNEFKIVRRFGSWVYLNRGRAAGLFIGTRLVGPNNSKLHIIRYAPYYEGQMDVSIAFIRHESPDAPLLEGGLLKLDPQIYPKK